MKKQVGVEKRVVRYRRKAEAGEDSMNIYTPRNLATLVLSTSRLETSREESSNRLVSGEEWARIVEKFLGLARMARAGSSL